MVVDLQVFLEIIRYHNLSHLDKIGLFKQGINFYRKFFFKNRLKNKIN